MIIDFEIHIRILLYIITKYKVLLGRTKGCVCDG